MYRILDLYDWFDRHQVEGWLILGAAGALIAWWAWRYSRRKAEVDLDAARAAGFSPDPSAHGRASQIDERLGQLPLLADEEGDSTANAGVRSISGVQRRQVVGGEDLLFMLRDWHRSGDGGDGAEDANRTKEYRVVAYRRHGRRQRPFALATDETGGWIVQGHDEWLIAARRARIGEGGTLGEFIVEAARIVDTFGAR